MPANAEPPHVKTIIWENWQLIGSSRLQIYDYLLCIHIVIVVVVIIIIIIPEMLYVITAPGQQQYGAAGSGSTVGNFLHPGGKTSQGEETGRTIWCHLTWQYDNT